MDAFDCFNWYTLPGVSSQLARLIETADCIHRDLLSVSIHQRK